MKNIFNNIWFVLYKTWKHGRRPLLIILLQVIIEMLVPLIAVLLPSMLLAVLAKTTDSTYMFWKLFFLLIVLCAINCGNIYLTSVNETYLLNNKIHFLTDLFAQKMDHPYADIESTEGQNDYQYVLMTLLNDNQGISAMLKIVGRLLQNLCSILLYMGIVAQLNIWLVAVITLLSLIHFILLKRILFLQDSHKENWVDLDKKLSTLYAHLSDGMGNKDIKLFSMQNWLSEIVNSLIGERLSWIKKLSAYNFYIVVLDIVLMVLRDSIAYGFLFFSVLNGQLAVPQFVFYFGLITSFSMLLKSLTGNLAQIAQINREVSAYRGYMEQPYDPIDQSRAGDHAGESQNINIFSDVSAGLSIELIDVSYHAPESDFPILQNINLRIEKGERLALVGENGAGKTTLVKLICGLYRPTTGKILIGGQDLNELSQADITKLYATVFQDIHVLPMSIAENIAFENAQEKEQIKKCLQLAGLFEVLPDMGAPLTKMIYQDGLVLSGGPEQKLMFARAAYKILFQKAPILILDEPTAALDPLAEKEFYQRYSSLSEDITTLFISHRLASTLFCDRIIVLEAGRIIEEGSHDVLIGLQGRYYELFSVQSRYYQPESKAVGVAEETEDIAWES